jgi:hypothetical protein
VIVVAFKGTDDPPRPTTRAYGSGQLMIGTELMLFFGLPSMTRSL